MKNSIAMAAVAGLASAAAGQVNISVIAPAQVNEGETFTVFIAADASVQNVGTTGFATSISGNGAANAGSVTDELSAPSPPGGFTVVSASASELVVENFVAFFGSFGREGIGASGQENLYSFTVTAGAAGLINIGTGLSNQSLATGANDAGFIATNFDVSFGSAVVEVVPTPGAAAVLGLGGLVAARRRR
ncbi:MAG: hypothetical protein AAFR38_07440 [Planctomycetota bacterium]